MSTYPLREECSQICSGLGECDSTQLCTDGRDHVQLRHAGFEAAGRIFS